MKLKCKRLQNEYIFCEVKGRITCLVHSKKRMKEIKNRYKKCKVEKYIKGSA